MWRQDKIEEETEIAVVVAYTHLKIPLDKAKYRTRLPQPVWGYPCGYLLFVTRKYIFIQQ